MSAIEVVIMAGTVADAAVILVCCSAFTRRIDRLDTGLDRLEAAIDAHIDDFAAHLDALFDNQPGPRRKAPGGPPT
jgi:hypothetical protein